LIATFTELAGVVETEIGCICTVALADLLGSACDVTVTVTSAAEGTEPGAVYNPVELMVPHALSEQVERLQVTAVFEVPLTVTVN
jgi:hypothetical protein